MGDCYQILNSWPRDQSSLPSKPFFSGQKKKCFRYCIKCGIVEGLMYRWCVMLSIACVPTILWPAASIENEVKRRNFTLSAIEESRLFLSGRLARFFRIYF